VGSARREFVSTTSDVAAAMPGIAAAFSAAGADAQSASTSPTFGGLHIKVISQDVLDAATGVGTSYVAALESLLLVQEKRQPNGESRLALPRDGICPH
jgi:hypothetical protein